ncbi:MAG: benzoate-CoA ligase family protein [Candidatus Rokubacteria bacterium]|nr:benzoate-CoA ligase family protein [Candidatus Rokubacteria bacterium]
MAHTTAPFLDARVAAGDGARVAIETPDARVTYAELTDLANRTGNALREMGAEPEQRVAMLLADGVDWAATFFGALRIGAVALPLNTRLAPAEWADMLADSRAKVLVADAGLARPLLDHGHRFPHLRVIVASSSLEQIRASVSPDLDPEPVTPDDMAFWLYTSGTTGGPKAAVHLHRDLLACRHYGADVLGVGPDDRVFATSKLFFAYALGTALLIPLFAGARTCLHPAWGDPDVVREVMRGFAPTLFFSVPTFYARLLRADLPRDTFGSVRVAVSAGERLPPAVYWAWRERFGVEILDGLGATETVFMVLSNRPGASRPGSAGTPVPGTDIRLLDDAGRDVPDGAPGVLHVRTPSASPWYWRRAEPSCRTFVGEWLRTGDVMTRDADGFHHHAGREDDFFKVAGLWVAPGTVEAALLGHPRVAEAGVVGAEEASGLVKPFAFVVAKDGGEGLVDELARLAAETLETHERPKRIVLVPELPRTATGKLQRFRLRELTASA